MKVFRLVFENIPIWVKWVILSIIVCPILTYLIVNLVTGQPINFDKTKILYLFILLIILLIVGFIIGSVKVIKNQTEKKSNYLPIKDSAFIAAPMMGFYTNKKGDQYKIFRENMLEIMELFYKECGINNIYYAGQFIKSKDEFHTSDVSITMNYKNLIDKEYFILIFPEKNASSSVLIEAGYALAYNKKSIYFFKAGLEIPFMLKGAANAYKNVKIYAFDNIEDLKLIIKNNKKEIFNFV